MTGWSVSTANGDTPKGLRRVARRARARSRRRRQTSPIAFWARIGCGSVVAALLVTIALSAASAVGAAVVVTAYLDALPSPDSIADRHTFQSTKIYDRHGALLYERITEDGGRRTYVQLADIPPAVIAATLSTEDFSFYTNPGFDLRGIGRALYQEFISGDRSSGGSTITQQFVRNVLMDPAERFDRSYQRKIKEIALAYKLNREYSKDRILEMYLNEIYYGNHAYGIAAAAESYFNKHVRDLTLAEAAMLAGLPQAPSRYNPLIDPEVAKLRQADVLDLMVRNGIVDHATAERAKQEELRYQTKRFDIKAPHFVFYVLDQLEQKYGRARLDTAGFQVYTTLDLRFQEAAEQAIERNMPRIRAYRGTNAALVAIDPKTGQILAMVGSADYWNSAIDGQVNVALMERQPGSSIKPMAYVAAFAKGWTPGTIVVDEPIAINDGSGKLWTPKNYDGQFHGAMTVREALGNSWNIPAVKALQFVGVPAMIEWSRTMGITTFKDPRRYGLAIALGGGEVRLLEHTGAYAVFANAGVRNPPTPILRILDRYGNLVEQYTKHEERVMSAELAYLITDILADPWARRVSYPRPSPFDLSRPAAAKTGATDDYRDMWTMGYTPNLVAGVWVGNANNAPMNLPLSSRTAGPVWHDFMEAAFQFLPREDFVRPPGVRQGVSACIERNPETNQCVTTSRGDLYIDYSGTGQAPEQRYVIKSVLVTKADGKLANEGCPADQVETRQFTVLAPHVTNPTPEERNLPKPPTEWAACARPTATPAPTATATRAPGQATPTPPGFPTVPIGSPGPPDPPIDGTVAPGGGPIGLPGAVVASPSVGAALRGTVTVVGSANVRNFASYKVEITPGLAGQQFTTLAESSGVVDNGVLATL
ncbi:MAG: PBP1A family penicillin-binding protein, partial [Dehalococcoidia bacterium]|nr:PBP1A family penicillin-binding protein [Dehalococcoidia bacterium]